MSSRKNSEIWNHFSVVDSSKAKCGYCSSIISSKGGSTGNLSRHMRTKHGHIEIYRKKRQLSTSNSACVIDKTVREGSATLGIIDLPSTSDCNNIPPCPSTSNNNISVIQRNQKITDFVIKPISRAKSKMLDHQLVRMIVKEYQPFKIVEEEEFKKFVHLLCPGYSLPCRKTISNSLIPQLYERTSANVKEKIKDAFAICITTDAWTSLNNHSFVGVTAHWIDADMEMASNLLECIQFNEQHTAENLCSFLKNIFAKWGIDNKITAIVRDNAANIKAAVKLGGWRDLACFAHSLNLIVQDGLVCIKSTTDKVKSIVEHFKRSSQALHKLNTVQEQMGLPIIKLKQDVKTRWNSTYDMFSRILKLRDAVVSTLAILSFEIQLSNDDWRVIETVASILQIFYEITEEISAEKNVTLSKIIIYVKALKSEINSYIEKYSQDSLIPVEINEMLSTISQKMSERFRDVEENELIAQATILDPRFKKFGFMNEHKFEKAVSILKAKASKECAGTTQSESEETAAASIMSTENSQKKRKKISNIWENFDQEVIKSKASTNPLAAGIVEVDKYLQEVLISRKENPLKWWEVRKHIYPRLYKIMLKRLCIVSTSVPCERIFSKAGQVLSEKRTRLKDDKVSQILFLNHNL